MLDLQKTIWLPEIKIEQIDDKTSRFILNHLPRWFGHTLGNSLRRLVLWYPFGSAITGMKIKWAAHEYTVLEWVKESVLDIMLAFKDLRFKLDTSLEEQIWVSQKFSSIWKVYAKDLKLPTGVELVTPDQYLFEITDSKADLYIEYRVEKWYGYYSVLFLRDREKKQEWLDTHLLLIDNSFSVINYFNYEINEVAVDFAGWLEDQLVIELQTLSDQINPKDVLKYASRLLMDYARLFEFEDVILDESFFTTYDDIKTSWVQKSTTFDANIKKQPIEVLWLSERTRNALLKNTIMFVEDLELKKRSELINMRWVWRKAVDEIEQSLKDMWKSLG